MLQDMFGEDSVPKMFKGEKFYVSVNDTKADIDLSTLVKYYKNSVLFCFVLLLVMFFAGSELSSG